jgi:hypothetical protein
MIRRACASLMLVGFLFQTAATVYGCTRIGSSPAHEPQAGTTLDATSADAHTPAHHAVPHQGLAAATAGQARVESGSGPSLPEHCNRFHRADCPHRGAAFHPCPSDQVAGLQAVDAGLPMAPEVPVFGLARPTASPTPTTLAPATPGFSPDLPPPRAI